MSEQPEPPESSSIKSYLATAGLFTIAAAMTYAGGETHNVYFFIPAVFLFCAGVAIQG